MRMRLCWLVAVLLILALAAPAFADRRSDAKEQVDFGIASRRRASGRRPSAAGRRPSSSTRPTPRPGTTSASATSSSAGSTTRARRTRRRSSSSRTTPSSATTTICSGKSMTARTAAAIASLALALGAAGCLSFYEIPVETPIQAKIDVSAVPARARRRASCPAASKAIDPNTETARLLRSQLRTKSDLKVIDADVLSLVDEVDKRRGRRAGAAPPPAPTSAATSRRSRTRRTCRTTSRSSRTTEYWKKIGERVPEPAHRHRLGAVHRDVARAAWSSTPQQYIDATGRHALPGSPRVRRPEGLRARRRSSSSSTAGRASSSTPRRSTRSRSTPRPRTRRRCRPTSS